MNEFAPRFRARTALVLAALAIATPAVSAQAINERSPLGVNLAEVSYWSNEWVFVDVFKTCGEWLPQRANSWEWDTGEFLDKDADGWIRRLNQGQAAGTTMCLGSLGNYPGGRYVCLYDGDGDLEFHLDASTVREQPGRIEVDVRPSNAGIWLKLVRTNPQNPLRNIRLIMPGFEQTYQTQPFHPQFLERWKPFKVLRFMGWGRANESHVRNWNERTTPSTFSQGRDTGIAYEYMAMLSNAIDADPWLSIPHLADDNYIRQLATLMRDSVEAGRKIYLEYSNEVWNGGFDQHHYAVQQGRAQGLSIHDWEAAHRFYAKRSVEIFQIFENVFAGQTHRLVRVLSSQNANPAVGREIMDWQNAAQNADVLAVAPYFGDSLGDPARQHEIAGMTVEQALFETIPGLLSTLDRARDNAIEASARGLRLVAYEGGQHLVGHGSARENSALTDLFGRANHHFAMGWLSFALLDGWRAAGGHEFLTFNSLGRYGKYGSWGVLEFESASPLTSPKYWGHVYFSLVHPRWW